MVKPSDRLESFFFRRFDDYLLRERVVCDKIGLTSKETETRYIGRGIKRQGRNCTYAACANGARCVAGSNATVAARRAKLQEAARKDIVLSVEQDGMSTFEEKHGTLPFTMTTRTTTRTSTRTSADVLRRCYLARWPGASLRAVRVSPSLLPPPTLPPTHPPRPPTSVLLSPSAFRSLRFPCTFSFLFTVQPGLLSKVSYYLNFTQMSWLHWHSRSTFPRKHCVSQLEIQSPHTISCSRPSLERPVLLELSRGE